MKNVITVTVDNPEDFKRVLGTLANIGASFTVERVEETKTPTKAFQRLTSDGKGVKEVVLDMVSDGQSATRSQISKRLEEVGFNGNSITPCLSQLRKAGLVRTSGDVVYPAEGTVNIALNAATQ